MIGEAMKGALAVKADKDFRTDSFLTMVSATIRDASLVIAILDDLPPNVAFQLGYALALKKPHILMVARDSVVNVKHFFPPECALTSLSNPLLHIDKHFSDIRDIRHVGYDDAKPDAPGQLLRDELGMQDAVTRRTLAEDVLCTWRTTLHEKFQRTPQGKRVFELAGEPTSITLGRPLLSPDTERELAGLLTEAVQAY